MLFFCLEMWRSYSGRGLQEGLDFGFRQDLPSAGEESPPQGQTPAPPKTRSTLR